MMSHGGKVRWIQSSLLYVFPVIWLAAKVTPVTSSYAERQNIISVLC